jgi:haloacetate dehalogenase
MNASSALLGPDFRTERIVTGGAEIHLEHGGSSDNPPLLLLHGYPQTHAMWHKLAPRLAARFHVVCPDLRGYGDSSKPPTDAEHSPYSKRAMAQDMVEVMDALGYQRFAVAGHDRGARVIHRLCLDHAERVSRACVMDITPTYQAYASADRAFATAYFHWFFLSQPYPFPERLLEPEAEFYLRSRLLRWGAHDEKAFAPHIVAEYLRCFCTPAAIHASCEDYRAAASIDLEHDAADLGRNKIRCPLLVLWGTRGFVGRYYDVLNVWRDWAERPEQVEGAALDCGHFLAEEQPDETIRLLTEFFGRS